MEKDPEDMINELAILLEAQSEYADRLEAATKKIKELRDDPLVIKKLEVLEKVGDVIHTKDGERIITLLRKGYVREAINKDAKLKAYEQTFVIILTKVNDSLKSMFEGLLNTAMEKFSKKDPSNEFYTKTTVAASLGAKRKRDYDSKEKIVETSLEELAHTVVEYWEMLSDYVETVCRDIKFDAYGDEEDDDDINPKRKREDETQLSLEQYYEKFRAKYDEMKGKKLVDNIGITDYLDDIIDMLDSKITRNKGYHKLMTHKDLRYYGVESIGSFREAFDGQEDANSFLESFIEGVDAHNSYYELLEKEIKQLSDEIKTYFGE